MIVTEIWRPWGHKCGVPGLYLFTNLSINYSPTHNSSCLILRRQPYDGTRQMPGLRWDPQLLDQNVIIHRHISRSNDREVCSIHAWRSARGKLCSSTNSSTWNVSWIIPQISCEKPLSIFLLPLFPYIVSFSLLYTILYICEQIFVPSNAILCDRQC